MRPRNDTSDLPSGIDLIAADHTERQTTLIVHNSGGSTPDLPHGADPLGLEDMVLTYLHRAEGIGAPTLQETRR